MASRGIAPLVLAMLILAPLSAHASITDDVANFLGLGGANAPSAAQPEAADIAAPTADVPVTVKAPDTMVEKVDLGAFALPATLAALPGLPPPSVEVPVRKIFCVEYARALSGLKLFGDAKYWWARARNLYARLTLPVEDAVMVFSASRRLRKGHVAVVTAIVSKREVRVDQANWQNHGEIDHATPVLDVSPNNDWSKVRVWDIHSGTFGAHVYAVSGFIAKSPVRRASRG